MKRSFGAWICASLMLLSFLFLAAGFAAAAPAPAAPPTLAGFWYGLGEPGDPDVFYIDAFHPDGRFNAEYRKCEKGKLVYHGTIDDNADDASAVKEAYLNDAVNAVASGKSVATAETVTMFTYSARKKSAKLIELYSVW